MNDRGRIPFALIGVLLLASSAALAPGLVGDPDVGDPDVDVAMDRLTAQAVSAIEEGVQRGARQAAREPVITRANTSFGRVLDRDHPFRDALKVRVYTAVREALAETTGPRRGIALTASLPTTDTPAALERAIDRVALDRAGPDGTAIRAAVGNVTLVARADGQVVGRKRIDPTVTVQVPTIAIHDRVGTFEQRLEGGPTEAGLGRRLTAKLYPVTWARGYAQYSGVPIQNVVANRHLSLLANGAVLGEQRRVFGRSDPLGRQVHGFATARAAIVDVLAVGAPDTLGTLDRLRKVAGPGEPDQGPAVAALTGERPVPDPEGTTRIGVNASADRAWADLLTRFNTSVDRTFTADVRVRALIAGRTGTRPDWPTPPADTCSEVARNRSTATDVGNRTATDRPSTGDWHLLHDIGKTVTLTATKRVTWDCGGEAVHRSNTTTATVHVDLRLEGAHLNGAAPPRRVRRVHEVGGPFDGPNLADVRAAAVDRLLPDAGTADYLAERAALGADIERTAAIQGDWPAQLYPWLYRKTTTLRERVRNFSVTPTRGAIATMQATPAKRLLYQVADNRTALARLPTRYANVSHRALVGLKWEYLDLLENRLERRVDRRDKSRAKLGTELATRQNASLDLLQQAYDQRRAWQPPAGPDIRMEVDAAPAYLTTRKVTRDAVPALGPGETAHPMVARNRNVFTLPYGDLAGSITAAIFGPKHTRLETGAQLLRTADRLGDRNESLRSAAAVTALRRRVSESLAYLRDRYSNWMAQTDVGTRIGWARLFNEALSTYDTTHERARAVATRRIVPRVLERAAVRWPDQVARPTWSDRLRVRSNYSLQHLLGTKRAGPPAPAANQTREPIRATLRAEVETQLRDVLGNATMTSLRAATTRSWARLPSGLPVAPVPGLWFATVNLWHVQVRGEYARFAVTVPRGTPANPGASVAYIRDGSAATLDLDGDGAGERLGTASRVSFATETGVAIAVPPNSPGVGDIDGTQDERSPGWPWPSDPPPGAK